MNKLIEYLQERLRIVIGTCYGLLALILAFSLYVDKSHAHTWMEKYVPFFWSLFGFAAAAVIIGFVYWFGHSGIMVREDYYEKKSTHCCGCGKTESSSEQA
ncbi:MAG: hypothetical protein SCH71_15365 [Desulfobulbaceae bacterium]|nr:hypothetical protein [Desulfobulbaceae bacterium]